MRRRPAYPNVGIVAMVPDRFEDPWQSRHHVLTRLARFFHVVWVEPTPGWRRALTGRTGAASPAVEPIELEGLSIYRAPRWLPKAHRPRGLARWMDRARARQIHAMLAQRGCRDIVLSLWRPEMQRVLDAIPCDLSLYHVDDDYRFSRPGDWPDASEVRLASSVDAVLTHSRELFHRKRHLNKNTLFLPNGVDYSLYTTRREEPPDLAAIPRPRIGYTGYLKPQLDWPLLRGLAEARPDWHFVFVGPVSRHADVREAVAAFAARPNVHVLPRKTQAELAAYPQHFDVCAMPYRIDRYSRSVYPLKLHEYLASGRPVVATPLEAVREFSHVVTAAQTVDEWVTAVERWLHPATAAAVTAADRQSVARRFDWDDIVERLATLILHGLDAKAQDDQERVRNSLSA